MLFGVLDKAPGGRVGDFGASVEASVESIELLYIVVNARLGDIRADVFIRPDTKWVYGLLLYAQPLKHG